jgi:hypothetical protein
VAASARELGTSAFRTESGHISRRQLTQLWFGYRRSDAKIRAYSRPPDTVKYALFRDNFRELKLTIRPIFLTT